MVDLHIHSSYSDGQHSPAKLACLAKEAGVSAWALTDHDTVDGCREAEQASNAMGLDFLTGIEISAKGSRELHILGYCVDPENEALRKACRSFRKYRNERKYRIQEYLAERGVHIRLEAVERYAGEGLVGRPHFARAMVECEAVANVREAFDKYLGIPAFDRVERQKPAPEEAVAMIAGAKGIAVLAHPQKLRLEQNELEDLVRQLRACGLRGIECFYSTHTESETEFYCSLAKRYGLLITGGSDFHGEQVKPEIVLGAGLSGCRYIMDEGIVTSLRQAAERME